MSGSLEDELRRFGARVREQVPELLLGYDARMADGRRGYVDQPGGRMRVRPWCDAVEIAAMFDMLPEAMTKEQWVAELRGFQDPVTGLVPEFVNGGPAAREEWYETMIVNYALECLGSHLAHPVASAEELDAEGLVSRLEGLDWDRGAWGAGHWVDGYASCLYANRRHFGGGRELEVLLAWLDGKCDGETGMWGRWRSEDRWLQAVNGYYRLTRGTYAQFELPLPHAERAMGTILAHGGDGEFFGSGRGDACNVLDVVHPIWLCGRQTKRGEAEGVDWIRGRLAGTLERWVDGRGMAFDPAGDGARGEPGLQGTEMWLAIIHLMADRLGLAGELRYRPRGVHRPEPGAAGAVRVRTSSSRAG